METCTSGHLANPPDDLESTSQTITNHMNQMDQWTNVSSLACFVVVHFLKEALDGCNLVNFVVWWFWFIGTFKVWTSQWTWNHQNLTKLQPSKVFFKNEPPQNANSLETEIRRWGWTTICNKGLVGTTMKKSAFFLYSHTVKSKVMNMVIPIAFLVFPTYSLGIQWNSQINHLFYLLILSVLANTWIITWVPDMM